MTTISSHTLDSTTGQDASGVRVICQRLLGSSSEPEAVFEVQSGDDGSISIDIDTDNDSVETRYEVVFCSGAYLARNESTERGFSMVNEIVIRVDLSKTPTHCHVPVLIAPYNYTLWWSR